jgi:CHAD domain-containing protein
VERVQNGLCSSNNGDLLVDAGYRILAARYVRKQAKQFRAQFKGICAAEDIEFVHRARVASRRLWAALQLFGDCFKRKRVKRWKRAVRRICAELGGARDKDVQIELIRGILDSLGDKTCFPGIARLLVRWEYRRRRLQRKVLRAVKRLRRDGALKELLKAAKRLLSKLESPDVARQSPESYARARREILERLDSLLSLQDCLARPDDQQGHHAMRIAAKRLRYALEILRPMYAGALDSTVEAVKQLQTLLGEVHDCDVWQEELDRFANDQRDRIKSCYGHAGPFARLSPGIDYLRQDRRLRREKCFQDLVRLWGELKDGKVWENLIAAALSVNQPPQTTESMGETVAKNNQPS